MTKAIRHIIMVLCAVCMAACDTDTSVSGRVADKEHKPGTMYVVNDHTLHVMRIYDIPDAYIIEFTNGHRVPVDFDTYERINIGDSVTLHKRYGTAHIE